MEEKSDPFPEQNSETNNFSKRTITIIVDEDECCPCKKHKKHKDKCCPCIKDKKKDEEKVEEIDEVDKLDRELPIIGDDPRYIIYINTINSLIESIQFIVIHNYDFLQISAAESNTKMFRYVYGFLSLRTYFR